MTDATSRVRGATVIVRRALVLVWRSGPGLALATVVLVLLQGLLPVPALYLMKLTVDEVSRALGGHDHAGAFGPVMALVGLAGLVALAGGACRALAGLVGEAQAQSVTDRSYDLLHGKSVEVDLEYYEDSRYHDTLHRAQQEASFRPARVLTNVVQVAQSGVALVTMAALLASLHWGVALVLFVAAAPGILVRTRYSGRLHGWQRHQTPAERRAGYFHWVLTTTIHAKEIRLFGLGGLFRRWFREIRDRLRRERLAIAKARCLAEIVTQASATVAVYGSYAFITYRTMQGVITLGDLVMYYQAFNRGQEFLKDMLGGMAGLYEDQLFLSSFYEFLDLERKAIESASPRTVPRPLRDGIVVDHVTFQYPSGTRKVLQDITLTIRPGEHVAFVGANGSGKTTMIKLLSRLYDPTAGTIRLDGIDLRDLATTALRREMSVVLQDYALYHLTARENIWLGDIDVPLDSPTLTAAARHSGVDDVIARLRRGYESPLGKWLEDGEELSVGEWQKVALARAFLRTAQIIVLDEPTSALDPRAEYELFRRFRQLVQGRTSIVVSHRFSTVRMADRIYVFDDGRIIEDGRHDDLMRRDGKYAQLFETQARCYR